jgi:hypothetical protein
VPYYCLASLPNQSQLSASLRVASLSTSSRSSAPVILSGTLSPTKSLSRALDRSVIPSNDRHRDSYTYKLYGSHCVGTVCPLMFIVRVPHSSSTTRFRALPYTLKSVYANAAVQGSPRRLVSVFCHARFLWHSILILIGAKSTTPCRGWRLLPRSWRH